MDRIKTKFIIAVSGKLAAAPDSEAKDDLIEELSENLYQRYLDLVAAGTAESEAYTRALADLGDVKELLAYLGGQNPTEEAPHHGKKTSFNFDNFMRGTESIVRETIAMTKDAVDQAKVIVKDVTKNLKEKYPDGINIEMRTSARPSVEGTAYPSAGLTAIDVQIVGDVTVNLDENSEADVVVEGNVEEFVVRVSDDGVLSIRPGKTVSISFRSDDLKLTIPARHWNTVHISTGNGDVDLCDDLDSDFLSVKTGSGDISCHGVSGKATVVAGSGDIALNGAYACVDASASSGDISMTGCAPTIHCNTGSGDIDLDLDTLPMELNANAASGDVEVAIPDGMGFTLDFSTVSGELDTEFSMVGPMGARSGQAMYLDGGESTLHIASCSGDISLRQNR